MDLEIADDDLRALLEDASYTGGFSGAIVKRYRRLIQIIQAAPDEVAFYSLVGLRFEKPRGKRSHQRSMRINDQWRLIVEIRKGKPKNTIIVVAIEDYHGTKK